MERGHRAQWASGEPPAKPSGLKRARPTTHGNFLNRLLCSELASGAATGGGGRQPPDPNKRTKEPAAHAPRRMKTLGLLGLFECLLEFGADLVASAIAPFG